MPSLRVEAQSYISLIFHVTYMTFSLLLVIRVKNVHVHKTLRKIKLYIVPL